MADSTSFPARISAAEAKLPAEIAAAIEEIVSAAYLYGYKVGETYDFDPDTRRSIEARAALDAAILSRLTAAESARDEAVRERDDLVKIMATRRAEQDAALARAERLEEALRGDAEWHESEANRLDCLPQNDFVRWQSSVHAEQAAKARAVLAHPAPAEET